MFNYEDKFTMIQGISFYIIFSIRCQAMPLILSSCILLVRFDTYILDGAQKQRTLHISLGIDLGKETNA